MAQNITSKLGTFRRNQDGAVAMTFALTSVSIVMLVGCAVDYGRAMHANMKMTNAIDSATIAAAKALKDGQMTNGEIQTMARRYFDENMKGSGNYAKLTKFDVNIDTGASKITISTKSDYQTAFTRVAGINSIPLKQTATAVFALRDIEVGLALDVTGSMGDTVKGVRKIDSLKSAVKKFADLMLPDTPVYGQKVRIGLAPYSSSANLGTYAKLVSNNRSTDGCVTERTTAAKYSDASVAAGGYFKVAADNNRDIDPTEGNTGNVAYGCPKAVLMPLTDKKSDIVSSVNSYQQSGWTSGHFGAQWGWNLVSEEWGTVFTGTSKPDAYSKVADKKLVKAVILMTDGIFNTAYNNDDSAKQAIELCKNMKDKGVQVFAIAFDAPAAAKKTLQACATPGSDYYADAADAQDLDDAFAAFAGKINALRLTQ
jgi:Flp pilus assembly protein TadG